MADSKNVNPAQYRGGIAVASLGVASGGRLATLRIAKLSPESMQIVENYRHAIKADGEHPLFTAGSAFVEALEARDSMYLHQTGNAVMNEFGVNWLGLVEHDGRIVGATPVQSDFDDHAAFEKWAGNEFSKVVDEVVRSLTAGESTVNIANMEAALGLKAHPVEPIRHIPLPGLGGAPWKAH